MKRHILLLCALTIALASAYAQNGSKCLNGTTRTYFSQYVGDYVSIIWSSGDVNGTRCTEWTNDGTSFRYEWNLSSGGSIGRFGRGAGSPEFTPRRVSDCGPMDVTKNVTFTDNGGGDWNNMIYGYWGANPTEFASVEYYVIDSQDLFWFGDYEELGQVTTNGSTYTCYRRDYRSSRGFWQYIALRDNQRSSGTVRLKTIFDFWVSKGAPNDYVNEISVGCENFNGGAGVWEANGLIIPDTDSPGTPTEPEPEVPTEGNVVFSARGTSGSEQVEVRYNDQTVGSPITLSTGSQEYRVQVDNPMGNFKVAFINDGGNRDVILDWLRVEAVQKEAEDQEVNTASWTEAGCGTGSFTQDMYCAGYIDFGTFGGGTDTPDPEPPVGEEGTIVIRAKGSTGSELMRLQVGDQLVESWENVSTTATDYTYEGYSGGEIYVLFDNDNPGAPEADRNLAVDYITVCGVEQPAEQAARSSCGETADGYAWLWCDGSLGFGDVGCSSAASASLIGAEQTISTRTTTFQTYPNPALEELTVEGSDDYQVVLYELTGRPLMQHDHLRGRATLNISHVPAGVYLIKMRDAKQGQISQRIIIE